VVEWRLKDSDRVLQIIGSNDARDWLFNFMTGRTIGDNERVNRWDRYEALVVLRAIRGLDINMIEGHSRGGAIAQIIARELYRRDGKRRFLAIYGSKRAGNRRFVDAVYRACHVLALRHRGDWIPFLPPWYAGIKHGLTHKPWRPVWIAHGDYAAYFMPR
jgi:hypothetical protein